MKKMALFGGTFDPIHNGHLSMALRLVEALSLDGVLLMPSFVPPHKIRESMADGAHRLEMCRLAIAGQPLLQVSDMELRRGGASFTVDTLEELHRLYPDTQWYLITGADMFCTLRTWHRFSDIARLAVLCTVARCGTDTAALTDYAARLQADGYRCYVDTQPVQTVSSTEIRLRAAAGQALDGLVPPCVEAYMKQQGLYQHPATMHMQTKEEQYTEIIRARLGEPRFHHSLCVAQEAKRLAQKYGADADKAYMAGLLHDIMKDTPPQAQLQILQEFAILLDDVEKTNPTLWHARTGAAFIQRVLGVDDAELVRAVRYHTTGRVGMTLLEKVLFVADFTSADRAYDDVDVMRRLADESLEKAMEYGIVYTIHDLLNRGVAIHPDTVSVYNELVLSGQQEGIQHEK